MTIQKEPPGLWFLTCDGCQDRVELETDPDDSFTDAVEEAKEECGYSVCKVGDDWMHICPSCQHDSREKALKAAGLL